MTAAHVQNGQSLIIMVSVLQYKVIKWVGCSLDECASKIKQDVKHRKDLDIVTKKSPKDRNIVAT